MPSVHKVLRKYVSECVQYTWDQFPDDQLSNTTTATGMTFEWIR